MILHQAHPFLRLHEGLGGPPGSPVQTLGSCLAVEKPAGRTMAASAVEHIQDSGFTHAPEALLAEEMAVEARLDATWVGG